MERKQIIQNLRNKNYTYQQIGNLFYISRQRVFRILHQLPPIPYSYNYGQPISDGGIGRVREIVRIRDNYTCQICGKVWKEGQRRFDVHHLDFDKNKSRRYDKVSEISNMTTLCHKCHLNLPEHRKAMRKENRNLSTVY